MPAIAIRHLSKTFEQKGNSVEALRDISLDIEEGDIYGIIGMSGAGKSTLVRCMNFLEVPSEGKVLIDGKSLSEFSPKELRKEREKIGMIFQHFNLLMQKSVLDNVCFPMQIAKKKKDEAKKRALELLETVGLADKADAYPAQLSGGEQQRVAIAIALANNPKLLLADEPTGAVDRKTADDILEMFRKLNEKLGLTIVIVTHDKELAKKVNRVVSIRDGKTSSERIMKNDYRERMEHLDIDWQEEETQEEFAVLDRAGRVHALFLCRHISFSQHSTLTIKLSQYNIGRNAEVVVYVSCNIKINCTTSMENIT